MSDWSYPNQYMPQSQYYKQDWDNHHDPSLSQSGYNYPESYYQQPYQQTASYTAYQDQPIEENLLYKSFEAFLESTRQLQIQTDPILPNNFQIEDLYSNFQVPPQQEEPIDFEESIEFMIQNEDSFT